MKISEMTVSGQDLSAQAQEFAEKNSRRWRTHGKHVGDMEQYQILQDGIYYSVWNDEELVACCSLSNSDNTVDDVWVNPKYRGQRIFSMMLWFFKTRLNRSPMMIGPVHSVMMQEVIRGLSRFEKSWINLRTNERQPFSTETVNQYYSHLAPTAWRLVLENSGEFNWPSTGGGFVIESYLPYVD
jgi:hypothetical protein